MELFSCQCKTGQVTWNHFKKVRISSNHNFLFLNNWPGVVAMKLFCNSAKNRQGAGCISVHHSHHQYWRKSLDAKQNKYLFKEIRQFCWEETMDIICPVASSLQHWSLHQWVANYQSNLQFSRAWFTWQMHKQRDWLALCKGMQCRMVCDRAI